MSRSRYPRRRHASRGNGSTIASIVVMTALLIVMITAQRGISNGISELFTGVTVAPEGSGAEHGDPLGGERGSTLRPATVRLGIQSPSLATQIAKMSVARAVQRAAREARLQETP